MSQDQLAERLHVAPVVISRIETAAREPDRELLAGIGRVLGCSVDFLRRPLPGSLATRPWLRAYADASRRTVTELVADTEVFVEVVCDLLDLRLVPDTLPVFDGELNDDDAIEEFAQSVRAEGGVGAEEPVGSAIRVAERLGAFVLPMASELGRHLGLSLRVNLRPVILVSRAQDTVPGDRQRFTTAHELGHLALHAGMRPPKSATESRMFERQAHRFAGAFLAPAAALESDLEELGGRVTLKTLARLKERWGVSVKALVMRFSALGVIDSEQARSLYKQISSRGWNRSEPVEVPHERAVWLERALLHRFGDGQDVVRMAAEVAGIDARRVQRWFDWSPTPDATVIQLADHRASGGS